MAVQQLQTKSRGTLKASHTCSNKASKLLLEITIVLH
jgi:hypothetical protein